MEVICKEYTDRADLEKIYDDYHIIARYYHWSRHDIKRLPSKERGLWVSKIIEHENYLNGGDKDSDNQNGV